MDLLAVLLREIEHGIRVLAWQKTEDANPKKKQPKNYPRRVPITAEQRADAELAERLAKPAGKPPPLELVKQWLGWERPREPKE